MGEVRPLDLALVQVTTLADLVGLVAAQLMLLLLSVLSFGASETACQGVAMLVLAQVLCPGALPVLVCC